MSDRSFTVLYAVAGLEPGAHVDESQLEGCNVDALIEGGFIRETGGGDAHDTPPDAAAEPPISPQDDHPDEGA